VFKFKFECVCFSFGKKMESFSLSLSWFPAHPAHPSISLFFFPPAAQEAPSAHFLPRPSDPPYLLPFPSLPRGTRPSAPSPSPCSDRTPGRVLPRPDVRAWARTPGCPAASISSAACALGPHQAAAAVLAPQETLAAPPCGALGARRRDAVPLLPVDKFIAQ